MNNVERLQAMLDLWEPDFIQLKQVDEKTIQMWSDGELLHEGTEAFIGERVLYHIRASHLSNREYEISGVVCCDMGFDDFTDKFIDGVEANGWSFGGGFRNLMEHPYEEE